MDDFGGADNQTLNFTMTFEKPYMVGLLIKKQDKLYLELKEDYNVTNMFLGNKTEHRLTTTTAEKTICMIFDFRNPNMSLMRSISSKMYWGMIGIIVTQFVLLISRNVGLLPVWILLEYL